MDNLFLKFRQQAIEFGQNYSSSDLEIDLLGIFPFVVRSPYKSQTIIGPYIQVQLSCGVEGICVAYKNVDIEPSFKYIGQNALSVLDFVPYEIQIGIIDAVFEIINKDQKISPFATVEFNGIAANKSIDRARYISSLISPSPKDRIGVIGCVEPIIRSLVDSGSNVRLADLHSIHKTICNVEVERDSMPILDWADKIILTGNALWSETISTILEKIAKRDTMTLVYAMTGHHIAPHYLNYGATIVTTEYFPFYWFTNVKSKLEVFMKK
jgi:hypothetical protein